MIARLVARELGLDLYQVDLSKVVSKFIGETEKHLSALFEAVESGHAILLFDEADSLFAKRTEVKGSIDRYANRPYPPTSKRWSSTISRDQAAPPGYGATGTSKASESMCVVHASTTTSLSSRWTKVTAESVPVRRGDTAVIVNVPLLAR